MNTQNRTRRAWSFAAALVLAVVMGSACDNLNSVRAGGLSGELALSHGQSLAGVRHAEGFCQPGPNCSACHGASLGGGEHGEPSCLKCHSDRWNRADCGRGGIHTVDIRGVLHASNYCKPLENCADCHGANLTGGSHGEPSCLKCHGDRWSLPGCGTGAGNHTIDIKGVKHAPDYCQAVKNCGACHGSDLRGGVHGEPTCYKCHGDHWNSPDCGQNTHTVNKGGTMHAPNYCLPYQNCVSCHGADLRGGAYDAPSCLQCHTQRKWMNCGSVQHNKSEDGRAHAMDYCKPTTYCTPCHGPDLRGGPNNEPSCYRCHGEKWKSSDCGR